MLIRNFSQRHNKRIDEDVEIFKGFILEFTFVAFNTGVLCVLDEILIEIKWKFNLRVFSVRVLETQNFHFL